MNLKNNIKASIAPTEQLIEETKINIHSKIYKTKKLNKAIPIICLASAICIAFTCTFFYLYSQNNSELYNKPSTINNTSNLDNSLQSAAKNEAINYNSIIFADGSRYDPDNHNTESPNLSSADIIAFSEADISQCSAIIEVTVKNVRSKNYYYQTFSDKFEKNGKLNNISQSIIYEVTADKVLYGNDKFTSGKNYIIEDEIIGCGQINKLLTEHRYVIPVYDSGENVVVIGDYAEGNIKKESSLSTFYPYHPQIEITLDGNYIAAKEWQTLIGQNGREIIIDDKNEIYSYDGGTPFLLEPTDFNQGINRIIDLYMI